MRLIELQFYPVQTSTETTYERIYRIAHENLARRKAAKQSASQSKSKKSPKEINENTEKVGFQEDDNYIEMEVSRTIERREFPCSEDEDKNEEDVQQPVQQPGRQEQCSINNNAAVALNVGPLLSAMGSCSPAPRLPVIFDEQPITSDAGLTRSWEVMQKFMVKKGIIDTSMTFEEMEAFVDEDDVPTQTEEIAPTQARHKNKPEKQPANNLKRKGGKSTSDTLSSASEVTIYKRAVQQIAPELEEQIDVFVANTRRSVEEEDRVGPKDPHRKVSSSSEELMDISDETCDTISPLIVGDRDAMPPAKAKVMKQVLPKTTEELAYEQKREAEMSRARIFEVEGKDISVINHIVQIDNDYQMIDAHIDEVLRKKILNLEYIELGKLLPCGRGREEEQKLEFVTKNDVTYLSPVGERDSGLQITSYFKWEQAFRIFCNVLTTAYPEKGPELLQYNHTIQTASTSYIWDNVYSYDKEFRRHIGHHPSQAWNVILQQAWIMLLKDRLKHEGVPSKNQSTINKTENPASDLTRAIVLLVYCVNMIIGVQSKSVVNLAMAHTSVISGMRSMMGRDNTRMVKQRTDNINDGSSERRNCLVMLLTVHFYAIDLFR